MKYKNYFFITELLFIHLFPLDSTQYKNKLKWLFKNKNTHGQITLWILTKNIDIVL